MSNLQLRVNQLMDKRNVTMHDLEKRTSVPMSSIKGIVDGSSKNPTIKTLCAIAKALDVNVEHMLSDELNLEVLSEEQLNLYNKSCNSLVTEMMKRQIALPVDRISQLIKEIYEYSLECSISDINAYKVDQAFIDWI